MIIQLSALTLSLAASVLLPVQSANADISNSCASGTSFELSSKSCLVQREGRYRESDYETEYAVLWVEVPSEKDRGFAARWTDPVEAKSQTVLTSLESKLSKPKLQSESKSKPKTKLEPQDSLLKEGQVQKSHRSMSSGSK